MSEATREEGLDKAREHLPDLVALDRMLPGLDGPDRDRQFERQHLIVTVDLPRRAP